MSKITGLVLFVAGAAVGSATTWYYAKKKYEQIAQEEIDSVKEVFSRREAESNDKSDKSEEGEDDSESDPGKRVTVEDYVDKVSECGYIEEDEEDDSDDESAYAPDPTVYRSDRAPYVISPSEFGTLDEYDQITLTYYADSVLVDENDEIIEDVEGTVGFESLTTFGEYEDDAVHVRNERHGIDYEILAHPRKFSEMLKHNPYS